MGSELNNTLTLTNLKPFRAGLSPKSNYSPWQVLVETEKRDGGGKPPRKPGLHETTHPKNEGLVKLTMQARGETADVFPCACVKAGLHYLKVSMITVETLQR